MIHVTLEQVDESKDNTKQRYIVRDLYYEIGRDPNCEMVIPSYLDHISHRHLSLTIRGDQLLLNHIGKNPSFLNGEKLEKETMAKNGDILKLTTEGPRYKIHVQPVNNVSPLIQFFRSKHVIWFYIGLAIWAVLTLIFFING